MSERPDWLRAVALMGKYDSEYKIILLGPLGEMYAVLQGDDDGTLRTITLDGQGRISAFVIDSTDAWGRMLSVGNAELAVRLGSAVHYDRRGEVVFVDSFEFGRSLWTLGGQGNNYAGALDPTTSVTGGYSFKLTAGSTSGAYANMTMYRPLAPTGRIGLEFVFAIGGTPGYVSGTLIYIDGSQFYTAAVRFGLSTKDLHVWNASGAWEKVADLGVTYASAKNYNTLKLVIDLDAKKYERVLINDLELDVSAYGFFNDGVDTNERIDATITVYGRTSNNDIAYIDDVILTLAEPAN